MSVTKNTKLSDATTAVAFARYEFDLDGSGFNEVDSIIRGVDTGFVRADMIQVIRNRADHLKHLYTQENDQIRAAKCQMILQGVITHKSSCPTRECPGIIRKYGNKDPYDQRPRFVLRCDAGCGVERDCD